jgi:hypothetical protein
MGRGKVLSRGKGLARRKGRSDSEQEVQESSAEHQVSQTPPEKLGSLPTVSAEFGDKTSSETVPQTLSLKVIKCSHACFLFSANLLG